MALTESAPAKINLGLHVLRRRPDGYHDIETVLHRIDWADTIHAESAETLSMTCSDPTLPTNEDNLCMEAARRLAATFGVERGATLHLEKRVSHGAGLGGGSSDAATTLRLLTRLWDLDATAGELRQIAREIGSDVPFFLLDAPAAYATDRGDAPTPLTTKDALYRLPYPLVVAVPSVRISTPQAYARVTPRENGRPDLRELVRSNHLSRWRETLVNDFDGPIADSEPMVSSLRDRLTEAGAEYVSLSGSGAAVYGVFSTEQDARAAESAVDSSDVCTHVVTTGR